MNKQYNYFRKVKTKQKRPEYFNICCTKTIYKYHKNISLNSIH